MQLPNDPILDDLDAGGESAIPQLPHQPGVLVVDDEYLVRSIVQLGLERNGFDVRVAANGCEAIALYREHREHISVVLLDVHMPGLDGPQTLAALRQFNPKILACFMSGDAHSYELEDLLGCGAVCFIAKPFYLDQLVNLLRRVIEGAPAHLLSSGTICRQ